ncbi:MAG: FAD-dependent oxidoreductase [Planctomycetota bacterium]
MEAGTSCSSPIRPDLLIVGGGVVGLTIAREAAGRGWSVELIDRGPIGGEASWAGAGMVPPGCAKDRAAEATPQEQLSGLSSRLHEELHGRLLDETGLDNGYRRCGAVYLADSVQPSGWLNQLKHWQRLGVAAEAVDQHTLQFMEPGIRALGRDQAAAVVPAEAQIRNPWHLRALAESCRLRDVRLRPGVALVEVKLSGAVIRRVQTTEGPIEAGAVCIASGCWSGGIAETLGLRLPTVPVRGQIALLHAEPGLLKRVVNIGKRYLVPREDGRILVGSTEENVGFEKGNTPEAVDGLLRLARGIVPALEGLVPDQKWSGLRPSTPDGLPYLGKLGEFTNAWIAAGHFRAGLSQSTGTAALMLRLIAGEPPSMDVGAFDPGRFSDGVLGPSLGGALSSI